MAPLKYERCSIVELRTFIHARTGVPSKPKRKKKAYIEHLQELDLQSRFRFLDLPPEMRTIVYTILLGCGDEGRCLHILRASKRVHDEAEPILYDDHTFDISLRVIQYSRYGFPHVIDSGTSAFHKNANLLHNDLSETTMKLHQTFRAWPRYLLKARRLRLTIAATRIKRPERCSDLQHLLYSLTCYRAHSKPLKSLKVTLRGMHLVQPEHLGLTKRILWPLNTMQVSGKLLVWTESDHSTARYEVFEAIDPATFGLRAQRSPMELQDVLYRFCDVAGKTNLVDDTREALGREDGPALRKLRVEVSKWHEFDGFMDAEKDEEFKSALLEMEDLLRRAISFT